LKEGNSYFAVSLDGDSRDLRWAYGGKPFFERGPSGSWDVVQIIKSVD